MQSTFYLSVHEYNRKQNSMKVVGPNFIPLAGKTIYHLMHCNTWVLDEIQHSKIISALTTEGNVLQTHTLNNYCAQ